MFTTKKYLRLLSCTSESELDKAISKISEADAKQFIKITIKFFQKQGMDVTDFLSHN